MANASLVAGPGRPKGSLNVATRELKLFWDRFFSSPEYRESAKRRILAGIAPHLEGYLLNKVYGKPREEIDLRVGPMEEDLTQLSLEELAKRADDLTKRLKEAQELEDAIPVEYRVSPQRPSVAENLGEQSVDTTVHAETPTEPGMDTAVKAEAAVETEQDQC